MNSFIDIQTKPSWMVDIQNDIKKLIRYHKAKVKHEMREHEKIKDMSVEVVNRSGNIRLRTISPDMRINLTQI